jgi:hypothetical protein
MCVAVARLYVFLLSAMALLTWLRWCLARRFGGGGACARRGVLIP